MIPDLKRLISEKRLARVQRRVETKGAVAIAVLDLLPPPFPFTAFILAAGAFKTSAFRFFFMLGVVRLFRFGVEALLGAYYGPTIVGWFRSEIFQDVAISLFVVAAIGTAVTIWTLVRATRRSRAASHSRRAA